MDHVVVKSPLPDQNMTKIKLPCIEDFTITKPISRGAFGKVFLGIKKDKPDEMYAIKVMKKSEMVNKNMTHQVNAERDALALSRSPFVVQLFYSMQSKNNIFLVMEYMIGGDLKSLLHVYGLFEENMAVFYIAEAVQALEYLHHHNIVHRDLKPDNMLISADGHMKLTDFGLSKLTIKKPIQLKDLLGTPSYINNSAKYLKSRTPGQLLSLTSSLVFGSQSHSSPHISDPSSPVLNYSKSLGCISNTQTSPFSSFSRQEQQEKIALSGSILKQDSFSNIEEITSNCRRSLEHHIFPRPVLKQYHPLISTSGTSYSSTNMTPFQPKPKRNILHSRSTRNLREMKSSGKDPLRIMQDKRESKRRLKAQSAGRKNKKRKSISSSNDSQCCLFKSHNSSGLSSGLLNMHLSDNNVKKISPKHEDVSFDSEHDSVFFSPSCDISFSDAGMSVYPLKSVPKNVFNIIDDDSDSSQIKCLHSSLAEEPEKRKPGRVNFCLKALHPSLSESFDSHSPIPPFPCFAEQADNCIKEVLQAESSKASFNKSPSNTKDLNTRTHSTPVSAINTPYRTPKSVRRGPELESDKRILGTPDYLAPEFLLHKEHGFEVDWWALGVCLFEFLTGVPPFNDVSTEAVFSNILQRDIPWPVGDEALSDNAQYAIDQLLTYDASNRPGAKELKTWPLFADIEWENLLQIKAPFTPIPDSPSDTTYFEARNSMQHLEVSKIDM